MAQTDIQTSGHHYSMTDLAQRAESVKTCLNNTYNKNCVWIEDKTHLEFLSITRLRCSPGVVSKSCMKITLHHTT